ncbi:MAG TPA: UrcA family protein [Steroidobacteraceae bacterium]|jgi:UrcA family protein|nr:UrcA family protein [Steroidobacteraceae bacterium]
MKFVTAFASATLLALVASHPAAAADPAGEARSIVVQFADLNLDTRAGAAHLLRRIRNAAERVCANPDRSLEKRMQEKACIKFAISNAVATVDRPMVSQYVIARSGAQEPAHDEVPHP